MMADYLVDPFAGRTRTETVCVRSVLRCGCAIRVVHLHIVGQSHRDQHIYGERAYRKWRSPAEVTICKTRTYSRRRSGSGWH